MKTQLQHWLPTEIFRQAVNMANRSCPTEKYWTNPKKWLREGWLASEVARPLNALRVRLGADINGAPDSEFELRDGTILRLQHVEADRRGRKRQDEHRTSKLRYDRPRGYSTADLQPEQAAFCEAIQDRIENKIRKKQKGLYDDSMSLLVHVNLTTKGFPREVFEVDLARTASTARSYFPSVWVWWLGQLYRI